MERTPSGGPISLPSTIAAPAYHCRGLYGVKTRQAVLRAVSINAQDMCVVGAYKDSVSTWVRSMKGRIRSLLSQSIRHQRIVDRANARQQLRAHFHVHRPPDCKPIDWRVLDGPFSH